MKKYTAKRLALELALVVVLATADVMTDKAGGIINCVFGGAMCGLMAGRIGEWIFGREE